MFNSAATNQSEFLWMLADGHLYIVMEYCDDGDLMGKIVQQRGRFFPEEMVRTQYPIIKQGSFEYLISRHGRVFAGPMRADALPESHHIPPSLEFCSDTVEANALPLTLPTAASTFPKPLGSPFHHSLHTLSSRP